MSYYEDDDVAHAVGLWCRRSNIQPSNSSGWEEIDGKLVIVLRNAGGPLAVYSVSEGGRLSLCRAMTQRIWRASAV